MDKTLGVGLLPVYLETPGLAHCLILVTVKVGLGLFIGLLDDNTEPNRGLSIFLHQGLGVGCHWYETDITMNLVFKNAVGHDRECWSDNWGGHCIISRCWANWAYSSMPSDLWTFHDHFSFLGSNEWYWSHSWHDHGEDRIL